MNDKRGICLMCKAPVNLKPNSEAPEQNQARPTPEEAFIAVDHKHMLGICSGSGLIPQCFEGDYQPRQEIEGLIAQMNK